MRAVVATLSLLACVNADPQAECPPEVAPPGACPAIYAPDTLQAFHIELSESTLEALQHDEESWEDRWTAGEEVKPYHPVESFKWGCVTITDAMIRLKGNPCCSWDGKKQQFVIAFNKNNRKHRFLGLRKIALDAPFYDPSLLRERTAFSALGMIGSTTSCANHAKLYINGEYYGLYTNLEPIDKEYLQRRFPDDADGNLYKYDYLARGIEPRTNKSGDHSDLDALFHVTTMDEVREVFNYPQALDAWVGEAILNQSDGYWAGSINYYLYHHPRTGWMVLPWDMDNAFDYWPADKVPDERRDYFGESPHLDVVLRDVDGHQEFIDALRSSFSRYDVQEVLRDVDAYDAQIHDALADDPHRPYTMEAHDEATRSLRASIQARFTYLAAFLHPDEP